MAKYPDTRVNYESDITQFLKEFDEKPEAHSKARKAEEEKYEKVHHLRDNRVESLDKPKLWSGF